MSGRRNQLAELFSLGGHVTRQKYLVTGVSLMLFKYAVEATVIGASTGLVYTPLDFINPTLAARGVFAVAGPEWLGVAWLAWTVPFVWIAVAMTMRRARSAAVTPWIGLLILVPLLNFVTMLVMACLADTVRGGEAPPAQLAGGPDAEEQREREAWQSPSGADSLPLASGTGGPAARGLIAALAGLGVGVVYTVGLMLLSVYGLGSYGAALFFGGPIVTGAAAAYVLNRNQSVSVGATLAHSLLLTVCCCSAFLLVGLEGAVCLVMAAPIVAPLTLLGAIIGKAIAGDFTTANRNDRGFVGCLLVLPVLAGVEPMVSEPLPRMVETSVTINAPPAEVWGVVVAFPEITAEPEWFFRWGIAAPLRARIDGRGVGAVRHCEFTTGAFVEPITVWDEPRRLAFDVTDQPEPMFELTPYRHLHPPHLKNSFRSTRGEFRLEPTNNGGTRLVGRTWYTLDIAPHAYWMRWTDEIVHRIHLRVLEHIQRVAETAPGDHSHSES